MKTVWRLTFTVDGCEFVDEFKTKKQALQESKKYLPCKLQAVRIDFGLITAVNSWELRDDSEKNKLISELGSEFEFVSIDYEVQKIKRYNRAARDDDFDSFFIKRSHGKVIELYGVAGIVPLLDKMAYRIK